MYLVPVHTRGVQLQRRRRKLRGTNPSCKGYRDLGTPPLPVPFPLPPLGWDIVPDPGFGVGSRSIGHIPEPTTAGAATYLRTHRAGQYHTHTVPVPYQFNTNTQYSVAYVLAEGHSLTHRHSTVYCNQGRRRTPAPKTPLSGGIARALLPLSPATLLG